MKPIRLSQHAARYMNVRGFTREEVITAIQTAPWKPAQYGENRFECSLEVPYHREWNGKKYRTKKLRPVFEERDLEIVVVTVYTYYY